MTPQERDLVTSLIERLRTQGGQPKDAEAEALIRRAMTEQPDAPYLLVQTVLIQDMALNAAQGRVTELERQLAAAKTAAPAQPTSFLGAAARGSVPSAGTWMHSVVPPAPAAAPVWGQSAGASPAAPPAMSAPMGSGFLRQAAATAAGIAGGALLFQGIESLFGPHYGGGWLGGLPTQPGLSETVTNNYYGDQSTPESREADALPDQNDAGDAQSYAADQDMSDVDSDVDLADQDFGDDSNYDV